MPIVKVSGVPSQQMNDDVTENGSWMFKNSRFLYIGSKARLLDGIFIIYLLPILEWQCLRF